MGPINAQTAERILKGGKTPTAEKSDNHDVYHQVKRDIAISAAEPASTPRSLREKANTIKTTPSSRQIAKTADEFSLSELTKDIVRKGVTNAAHGMSSTLSWLEGAAFAPAEMLTGFDDLQELHGLFYNWDKAIEKEREDAYQSSEANIKAGGTAAKIADAIGTGVVAAIPQAATAVMSAGMSLGAVGAKGLEATAAVAQQSPGILNSLRSAAARLANNPNYWTSFLRTAGESYEQAKADGAGEGRASLYAVGNGLFNAAVEIGGGVETLPKGSRNKTEPLRSWLQSSVEEGAEEPIQGVIERGLQNAVYSKKNPQFSLKDETAIVNPVTAAKEFGMGTAVGGILGGGQMAVGKVKNVLAPRMQSMYSDYITKMGGADYGSQRGKQGGTLGETAQTTARGDYAAQTENGNRPRIQSGNGKVLEAFRDVWQRHGGLSVAQESQRMLSEYNADTHIIPESEWNRQDSAYTRNAEVYMRESIPEENRGMIAPHEGTHVMKQAGYQPYLDFVDRTPDMLNFESDKADKLLSGIAAQRGIDPFNATETELKTLYDELNATIYGHVASDNMPQDMREGLRSAFLDFDAYSAELSAIHKQYINSRYKPEAQTALMPPFSNAARPYAGTPRDYAALLKRLAEGKAAPPALTPQQRKALEIWNDAHPEMQMTEEEFLGR